MRRTKAATRARGMRRYKTGRKTFARAVKSVLHKVAETKRHNTIIDTTLGIANNTFITWNLLNNITQGTNTSQRVGDKIHIKNLRLGMDFTNYSSSTGNSTIRYRVVLFRGKYDYSTSSYPIGEIFENNAGSGSTYAQTAPVDLNQVTLLKDFRVDVTNNYSTQKVVKTRTLYVSINKAFNFRDDDNFGKTSNLYLGVFQINADSVACNVFGNCTISYTDQ